MILKFIIMLVHMKIEKIFIKKKNCDNVFFNYAHLKVFTQNLTQINLIRLILIHGQIFLAFLFNFSS